MNSMFSCRFGRTSHFQDLSRILHYKNMGQEALWLDCAEKLTTMIQNIIEFAKLIPGFMRLSQDDQVRAIGTNPFCHI